LNPASDGQVVRVPIPALTGDRRKDLVKQVGKIAEEVRIRLRGIRREYNELLKDAEKEKDITEDQLKSGTEKVQKITDEYIKKVDEIAAAKEKDVLTV
ncbi:MAG TPA: ribosome-recycling factor, partial [Myxococcota bacterium]|nr:ribosome-recycling factor [Myxococcota bacterium]